MENLYESKTYFSENLFEQLTYSCNIQCSVKGNDVVKTWTDDSTKEDGVVKAWSAKEHSVVKIWDKND